MSLLLDTNVCIAWLNGTDRSIRAHLLAVSPKEIHLCSIVKAELLFGARKSSHVEKNLKRLDEFFAALPSLVFDDAAAEQYGLIRAQLQKSGNLIGPNDLLIAAIALSIDATVVTRNDSEFRRVAGLRVVTW